MRSITREYSFDAAHRLYGYPGKCCNIHGHTYKVFVTIESLSNVDTRTNPFLLDFGTLKKIVQPLMDAWDHKLILSKNDPLCSHLLQPFIEDGSVVYLDYVPSAENMARYLAEAVLQKYQTYKPASKLFHWEALTTDKGVLPVAVIVTVYETPKSYATYRTPE